MPGQRTHMQYPHTHTHTFIRSEHFNSDCGRREASSASKWTSGSNCCRACNRLDSHTHTHLPYTHKHTLNANTHTPAIHTHTELANSRGNQNEMHLKCQRRIKRNPRDEAAPSWFFSFRPTIEAPV